MLNNKISIKALLILFSFSCLLFIISLNEGLFWDNVLFVSKIGGYLFENGLFSWYMPDKIDPGHPPFLGFVQALGWKIFGKHLWVSHLMMWPFVFGFLIQTFILIGFFVQNLRNKLLALLLVVADPTISAELIQVSPEIIQVFFFLLAVNGILKNNHLQKTVALAFLGIVFLRGMMLCAGVFLFELLRHVWLEKKSFNKFLTKQTLISYLIGATPAVIFIIWRLLSKGWLLQTQTNSPWAESWHFASVYDFLRNILVLANRLGDFGRIFILLFIGLGIFFIRSSRKDKSIYLLILLGLSSILIVTVTSLLSTNAFGHRYFITFFIATTIISYLLIDKYLKKKRLLYIVLLTSLLTGNLWIYPERIAQGWSASLAHYPYFKLRKQAIEYIDNSSMNLEQFASFFPNVGYIDGIDLGGDMRKMKHFEGTKEYIFYSNVYNLSDEQYDIIAEQYSPFREFEKNRVKIILYRKK